MHRCTSLLAPLPLAAFLLFASLTSGPAHAQGHFLPTTPTSSSLRLFALTDDGRLLSLRESSASSARVVGRIGPLAGADRRVLGVDFRATNGRLYALADGGGIYRVSTSTALATLVSRMSIRPSGVAFGIDFDPVLDRLRVVSDTAQNLQVNVDTGAALAGEDLHERFGSSRVTALGVTGIAYSNNDTSPSTGTILYALDTDEGELLLLAPPDEGSLGFVGALGLGVTGPGGFDVYSSPGDGQSRAQRAFATVQRNGRSRLLRVNLVTGLAKHLGAFATGLRVIDVTLPLDQGL